MISSPVDMAHQITADPSSFTIAPAQAPVSHAATYVFPAISYADSRLLVVASANALVSSSRDRMALKPLDDRSIVVRCNTSGYVTAMLVSLAGWLATLAMFMARSVCKKRRDLQKSVLS
jgi:hypothetical protein